MHCFYFCCFAALKPAGVDATKKGIFLLMHFRLFIGIVDVISRRRRVVQAAEVEKPASVIGLGKWSMGNFLYDRLLYSFE